MELLDNGFTLDNVFTLEQDVMIGTAFLAVGLTRVLAYHLTNNHHLGLEAGILYWHFVDVVWLFLFVSIYYWGS
jgi:cytochrome c oxidase subunit 3